MLFWLMMHSCTAGSKPRCRIYLIMRCNLACITSLQLHSFISTVHSMPCFINVAFVDCDITPCPWYNLMWTIWIHVRSKFQLTSDLRNFLSKIVEYDRSDLAFLNDYKRVDDLFCPVCISILAYTWGCQWSTKEFFDINWLKNILQLRPMGTCTSFLVLITHVYLQLKETMLLH